MPDILIFEVTYYDVSSTNLNEFDKKFALKLFKESNSVASKIQIYCSLYNTTYFKYRATASRKCWFDFFHLHINKIQVIELTSIDLSRNHPWVNPWDLTLASITGSNHSIHFILSNVKALALVCYIINYAKKKTVVNINI